MRVLEEAYPFGENWNTFVQNYLTTERIEIAKKHLSDFLELPNLNQKSFMDVGCGSGLSSLAAYNLGAAKIISFDVDSNSVNTTKKLWELAGKPHHWDIFSGSILDPKFTETLTPTDIVYSWGVLHHTGDMWKAFRNTVKFMNEDSLLYIALYTKTRRSPYWLRIKKKYNQAALWKKRLMEFQYILRYTLLQLMLQRRNPIKFIRDYHMMRGMAYLTDIRDWLGGYPFEDAKIEEVIRFAHKDLNLQLKNIQTGEANTEYLFSKKVILENKNTIQNTL